MEKTEIIHVRVCPRLKKDSEEILRSLGVNTSYAISMFLEQVVYKRGFPFDVSLPSVDEQKRREKISKIINSTGGKEISKDLQEIIHLYASGKIDYDTACLIVTRKIKNA